MTDMPWFEFTKLMPTQHQRILAKGPHGVVVLRYNRFDYTLWGLTEWKPMPSGGTLRTHE
jgi:hypothetical protein